MDQQKLMSAAVIKFPFQVVVPISSHSFCLFASGSHYWAMVLWLGFLKHFLMTIFCTRLWLFTALGYYRFYYNNRTAFAFQLLSILYHWWELDRLVCMHAFYFQYLHLYTTRTGHVSSRFEKLVKIIGTHLTPYVYTFITYVQVHTIFLNALSDRQRKFLYKSSLILLRPK